MIKTYIPIYLRKPISRMVKLMEYISAFFFDAVITNDNFVLQSFHHAKEKEVVFNFPALENLRIGSNEFPYEKRTYDIIFIGSLPKIHFEPMLAAAEILRERKLCLKWLLLPLQGAPREWIMAQIHERNLEEYFIVASPVPFDQVPQYLYNSRIGIIPIPPHDKFLKNIPLKLFEYLGCGLPVIASDLPPTRQFVYGKDCALLVPHDPKEYANAIVSLLANPIEAEKMGKNGQRLIEDLYNWSSEEKKMLSIYSRLR